MVATRKKVRKKQEVIILQFLINEQPKNLIYLTLVSLLTFYVP